VACGKSAGVAVPETHGELAVAVIGGYGIQQLSRDVDGMVVDGCRKCLHEFFLR